MSDSDLKKKKKKEKRKNLFAHYGCEALRASHFGTSNREEIQFDPKTALEHYKTFKIPYQDRYPTNNDSSSENEYRFLHKTHHPQAQAPHVTPMQTINEEDGYHQDLQVDGSSASTFPKACTTPYRNRIDCPELPLDKWREPVPEATPLSKGYADHATIHNWSIANDHTFTVESMASLPACHNLAGRSL
jgi:hypothetical protein